MTYMRLTQNTMLTNNILQLLALVVFTTERSAADCVVEWDDGNVVATQLEVLGDEQGTLPCSVSLVGHHSH